MGRHVYDGDDWCSICRTHRKDSYQVDCHETAEELQKALDEERQEHGATRKQLEHARKRIALADQVVDVLQTDDHRTPCAYRQALEKAVYLYRASEKPS